MGEITVHGKIISFDTREIRNEKTIIIFSVTDFTDTITVKNVLRKNEQLPEILGELKKGSVRKKSKELRRLINLTEELTIASVTGIKKIGDFTVQREDLSPIKRVELHCHTKMSDMDGVSEVKDIVKRAHDWGNILQSRSQITVWLRRFRTPIIILKHLIKTTRLKVLYGVEGYVVDDLTEIAVNAGNQTLDDTYIVFDIETTRV